MGLIKNEIPILEYDDCQTAVLMPNKKQLYSFPKKAVFPFLGTHIDDFAQENNCEKIGEFVSITKIYSIYEFEYKGEKICLCQAPVGASAAVQFLDFLIGCGVEQIISAGSCGALTHINENEFLIPTEALRCEGTSYHYLPPSRTVKVNEKTVFAIEKALKDNLIPFSYCKTWTTDGFFRETKEFVEYRKSEGFTVVEMECSALCACAEFRKVTFGQFLYTADTLADIESHDDRNWGEKSIPIALKLCFDAVISI